MSMALVGNSCVAHSLSSSPRRFSDGENVERGEGFIHEEGVGFDHEGPGEADALAHAAGKLLGIGRFEAVESDQVDDPFGLVVAAGLRHPAGFEAQFDVLAHRQPGQEREGLEDHGGAGVGTAEGLASVGDLAGGWGDEGRRCSAAACSCRSRTCRAGRRSHLRGARSRCRRARRGVCPLGVVKFLVTFSTVMIVSSAWTFPVEVGFVL